MPVISLIISQLKSRLHSKLIFQLLSRLLPPPFSPPLLPLLSQLFFSLTLRLTLLISLPLALLSKLPSPILPLISLRAPQISVHPTLLSLLFQPLSQRLLELLLLPPLTSKALRTTLVCLVRRCLG